MANIRNYVAGGIVLTSLVFAGCSKNNIEDKTDYVSEAKAMETAINQDKDRDIIGTYMTKINYLDTLKKLKQYEKIG